MKLISACLIGVKCAWDGKDKYQNKQAIQLLESSILIPVCPEQLGGLKTPRLPQEIQGGSGEDVLDGNCRIINRDGVDVTREFIAGATETLKIARQLGIDEFIGKCNSPSCGFGQIYDGTFTGNLVPGNGVTTALLKRHGIKIITEKEL
jgi:uncharacterized protein YbbK (DUF523 family)